MPKRVITAAVGVVGLVVIGLGVASATVWRADDVLVATATSGDHLIVTDPGVLELGGDPVTVRATTSGGDPVVLAIGRDTDVAGWVGADAHTRVTGLSTWHELETDVVTGQPSVEEPTSPTPEPTGSASDEPSPSSTAAAGTDGTADETTTPDPTDSDLWVAQATGDGSARLVWPAQDGRWSLLVAGTGDSAPTLSLSWPRVVTTPWLWPLVILGAILALGAGALLFRDWNRRRTGADEQQWHPVTTGAMPTVGEPSAPLTRRQIREAELAARAARPRTAAIPRVATPASGTPHLDEGANAQDDTVVLDTRSAGLTDAHPTGSPEGSSPGSAADPAARPTTGVPVASAPAAPTRAVPTRRALRTGAVPVVRAEHRPAPAEPSGQSPAAPTPTAPGSGTPATTSDSQTPTAPGSGTPATSAGAPTPTPSGPTWTASTASSPGSSASAPGASTSSADRTPSTAPAGGEPAGAPRDPGDSPVPGGMPWRRAARGAAAPSPAAPSPAAPSPAAPAPGSWVPVPPPSSAPTSPRSVTRPAWLPISSPDPGRPAPAAPRPAPTDPQAPSDEQPSGSPDETEQPGQTGGSRADAWRRAWGLPATEDDATEQGEDR